MVFRSSRRPVATRTAVTMSTQQKERRFEATVKGKGMGDFDHRSDGMVDFSHLPAGTEGRGIK